MASAIDSSVEGRSPRPWASAIRRLQWRWHVVVTLGWALALAVSPFAVASGSWHDLALGGHLLGLVLSLGAVLLVDWHGLVWPSGLRTFRDSLRVGEAAHPMVWRACCSWSSPERSSGRTSTSRPRGSSSWPSSRSSTTAWRCAGSVPASASCARASWAWASCPSSPRCHGPHRRDLPAGVVDRRGRRVPREPQPSLTHA